ncbi:MAG: reverse transcriptase domain-containing protein, partial [Pseudomonadota bacterium]
LGSILFRFHDSHTAYFSKLASGIERGCSQGTVGGPAIFSILTNDASSSRSTCKIIKYSDDMSCVIPCAKDPSSYDKMLLKAEFEDFSQWATKKNLQINEEKTKQIRFSLNPDPESRCSCTNLSGIQNVTEIKILGVTFQKNGLFAKHVKNVLAHARSLLYLLKDMHHHQMPINEVNRLFESVILSRIRYAISVYGCDDAALRKVDRFLEKCRDKNYCSERFSAYEILEKEDRRLLQQVMNNENHPLRPYILSHKKQHSFNTRTQYFGVKPKTKTRFFLRTFCNRILTL